MGHKLWLIKYNKTHSEKLSNIFVLKTREKTRLEPGLAEKVKEEYVKYNKGL